MIYECIPESVERIWGSLPPPGPGASPSERCGGLRRYTAEVFQWPVGKASDLFPSGEAPVILKTLHPAKDLSVQVHPGKNGKPPMKDESWAILSGTGRILHGIREGTGAEDFARAVKGGFVESRLLEFQASPGDIFHLPAGTVHALGAGSPSLRYSWPVRLPTACGTTEEGISMAIQGNFTSGRASRPLTGTEWEGR